MGSVFSLKPGPGNLQLHTNYNLFYKLELRSYLGNNHFIPMGKKSLGTFVAAKSNKTVHVSAVHGAAAPPPPLVLAACWPMGPDDATMNSHTSCRPVLFAVL